jgi:hypothetical protein
MIVTRRSNVIGFRGGDVPRKAFEVSVKELSMCARVDNSSTGGSNSTAKRSGSPTASDKTVNPYKALALAQERQG